MDKVKSNSEPETLDSPSTFGGRRPSSGSRFSAIKMNPEGWVVLSPWIKSQAGELFRLHCCQCGQNQSLAEHLADQLNAANDSEQATADK
jgi:hypothetical protein